VERNVKLTRLLARAQGGQADALGDLLEACRNYLRWEARRQIDPDYVPKGDASDMVQETFLDAYRDFAQFRGHSEEEFLAWLRHLLRNNVSNFFRRYRQTSKRNVRAEIPLDAAREPSGGNETVVRELLDGERDDLVRQATKSLSDDYQRILNMWTTEGLSFEEIARRSDCSPSNIRAKWFRAIQKLNDMLSDMK